MSELHETIAEFSDELLLEQYINHQNEYVPEAVEIMAKEIQKRNLSETMQKLANMTASTQEQAQKYGKYSQEEFVALDHLFSQTDVLLAHTMLAEHKIPVLIETSMDSDTITAVSKALIPYIMAVPAGMLSQAQEIISTHFEKIDGKFIARFSTTKDRLKSFSLNELQISPIAAEEIVDVTFSPEEATEIRRYLDRMMAEADTIEQDTGRIFFYIDNCDHCRNAIQPNGQSQLTRIDLVTILEALQAYCEENDFPPILEKTADALLNFCIS
ncbi:MAG: hypothetical protein JW795_06825 [Chitinivibrionales bacterium]|nr:hypothetical protein [Chitinivibrionales bacterium]